MDRPLEASIKSTRVGLRPVLYTIVRPLCVAAMVGLAACSSLPNYANPIEWYRDLTGVSKNDDETDRRNTQNLAAGAQEPFPNLASVPPPPDTAQSGIDREKLQQGLIADRTHAKYSDEELRAGRSIPAPPTPAAQSALSTAISPSAGGSAVAAPTGGGPRREAASAARSESAETTDAPRESSAKTPSIPDLPEGESVRPAPAAPDLRAPVSGRTSRSPSERQVAALPPATASELPPASSSPATVPARRGKGPTVSMNITAVEFPGGVSTLAPEDGRRLGEVVKLYRQNGGRVRVIGYSQPAYGADAAQFEMATFSQALDRANAVAQQLSKLGIPSGRIAVEATTADIAAGTEADTVEVFLEF